MLHFIVSVKKKMIRSLQQCRIPILNYISKYKLKLFKHCLSTTNIMQSTTLEICCLNSLQTKYMNQYLRSAPYHSLSMSPMIIDLFGTLEQRLCQCPLHSKIPKCKLDEVRRHVEHVKHATWFGANLWDFVIITCLSTFCKWKGETM